VGCSGGELHAKDKTSHTEETFGGGELVRDEGITVLK
jgi:hypothetical protein